MNLLPYSISYYNLESVFEISLCTTSDGLKKVPKLLYNIKGIPEMTKLTKLVYSSDTYAFVNTHFDFGKSRRK